MKIIVCIKQVPDISIPIDIEADGQAIVEDGLIYIINPQDLCALELAVQLKERIGGEVTVITLGQPRAEEALRSCLAAGADKAIFLLDQAFAGSDSFTTAIALAEVIKKSEYDLILTGSESLDGGHNQVTASIAQILNIPFVSGVTNLEIKQACSIVYKKLERGDRDLIECSVPAVFGVTEEIADPRYPSLPALIEAFQKDLVYLKGSDLGLRREQLGTRAALANVQSLTPPRPRPKKTFTPDSNLSPAERMKQLMSGGIKQKKSSLLEGAPEELAAQIVGFLKREQVILANKI